MNTNAAHSGVLQSPSPSEFCTDLGNARRLVARHGDEIHYVAQWNQWLVWNEFFRRWEIDQNGAITRLAENTVLEMLDQALQLNNQAERNELLKHAMKSQSEARINAMINLARDNLCRPA